MSHIVMNKSILNHNNIHNDNTNKNNSTVQKQQQTQRPAGADTGGNGIVGEGNIDKENIHATTVNDVNNTQQQQQQQQQLLLRKKVVINPFISIISDNDI